MLVPANGVVEGVALELEPVLVAALEAASPICGEFLETRAWKSLKKLDAPERPPEASFMMYCTGFKPTW